MRGGSTVPSAMTAQNKTMVAPGEPQRSGYTFAGWYKDADCTQAWDFSKDVVTADMTLYAKWTKNAVTPGGNGGSASMTARVTPVLVLVPERTKRPAGWRCCCSGQ